MNLKLSVPELLTINKKLSVPELTRFCSLLVSAQVMSVPKQTVFNKQIARSGTDNFLLTVCSETHNFKFTVCSGTSHVCFGADIVRPEIKTFNKQIACSGTNNLMGKRCQFQNRL